MWFNKKNNSEPIVTEADVQLRKIQHYILETRAGICTWLVRLLADKEYMSLFPLTEDGSLENAMMDRYNNNKKVFSDLCQEYNKLIHEYSEVFKLPREETKGWNDTFPSLEKLIEFQIENYHRGK